MINPGNIQVIVGTMCSGKTTELKKRLIKYYYAGKRVALFSKDARFGLNVGTHVDGCCQLLGSVPNPSGASVQDS